MGKQFFIFFICAILVSSVFAFSACGGSRNGSGGGGGGGGGTSSEDSGDGGNIVGDLLGGLTGGKKSTVEEDPNLPDRNTTPIVLDNIASGAQTAEGNGAVIDYSNASDGYIMAKYDGDNPKIKLQITKDGEATYTYDLWPNKGYDAFPLSLDSGNYSMAVFTNIQGDQYSQACAAVVQADIADTFSPFLRPNQFSSFTSSTRAVSKGAEIAQGSKTDLGTIEKIFIFITENVSYDYEKAATVQPGYLPVVDETLSTGKGICFDYAALMTCMLRTQRIPCRLVVGYAGDAYHAWISVHVDGVGWVANMIQFNDDKWTFMDPTFAASGDTADPNVIGDGENYNPMFYY